MTKDNNEVEFLRNQLSSLKKKLGLVTLLGILFGGGGLFGAYKWYDSERRLTATQIRQNTIESEIKKNEALNKHYSQQIMELEAKINKKGIAIKELEKAQSELKEIEEQKKKVNEEFRRIMPATW
ncbi:MAG: hypothetical protein GXP08_03730 [Gammaproteobacteria bacterium]|nr:hypothetical protein [Gammaproteobacteria bacterium]